MSVTDITINKDAIINPNNVSILIPYLRNISANNTPVINSTIGY